MKNVTIYTKEYCPYCRAAKQLLTKKGIDFRQIDVEFDAEKRQEMVVRSGRMTVPQVFFGEQHIGGYDDLVAHYSRRQVA